MASKARIHMFGKPGKFGMYFKESARYPGMRQQENGAPALGIQLKNCIGVYGPGTIFIPRDDIAAFVTELIHMARDLGVTGGEVQDGDN